MGFVHIRHDLLYILRFSRQMHSNDSLYYYTVYDIWSYVSEERALSVFSLNELGSSGCWMIGWSKFVDCMGRFKDYDQSEVLEREEEIGHSPWNFPV
jgi:hypothetical protein